MTNCLLLLNTGDQVLLNTGDNVLLNDDTCSSAGLTLSGTHSGVALIGPRPEQLIPVEFTFRLKSCLITSTGFRICVKSVLERLVKTNAKFKSLLIIETHRNIKLKSSLIRKIEEVYNIQLKSTIWAKPRVRTGLFANTEKSKKKKAKELLLRKLKEIMDEDE